MKFEFIPSSEIQRVIQLYNLSDKTFFFHLPERGSSCSAGYDFYLPFDVQLSAGEQFVVPTFVRVKLEVNRALFLYPRSSFGINKGIVLANTVAIIDAHYYDNPTNGGHIFVALKNTSNEFYNLTAGTRFVQGVIQNFFLVDGDSFSVEKFRWAVQAKLDFLLSTRPI